MKMVVLGCGRVGSTLALLMDQEGHQVSVIDRNRESFRRLPKEFAGNTVLGMGIDEEVLKRAGIQQADAFVAVTSGDNTNIMAAQIARERFQVPRVVARIYDPVRADFYANLGIETICSTTLLAGLVRDFLLGQRVGDLSSYLEISHRLPAG